MTTTTEAKAVILKRDVLGRVKVPAERREAILDEYGRSGLSGQAYARRLGIKYLVYDKVVEEECKRHAKHRFKKLAYGKSFFSRES